MTKNTHPARHTRISHKFWFLDQHADNSGWNGRSNNAYTVHGFKLIRRTTENIIPVEDYKCLYLSHDGWARQPYHVLLKVPNHQDLRYGISANVGFIKQVLIFWRHNRRVRLLDICYIRDIRSIEMFKNHSVWRDEQLETNVGGVWNRTCLTYDVSATSGLLSTTPLCITHWDWSLKDQCSTFNILGVYVQENQHLRTSNFNLRINDLNQSSLIITIMNRETTSERTFGRIRDYIQKDAYYQIWWNTPEKRPSL